MRMRFGILSLITLSLVVSSDRVAAQTVRAGLLAGRSVPTGEMGERREAGWTAGGLLMLEWSRWAVRAEVVHSRYSGREADLVGVDPYRDLRNWALLANVLYVVPGERVRPYVLVGTGAHRTQEVGDPANTYGWVAGVLTGGGVSFGVGRLAFFAEARWEMILSDYGNGDFEPSTYVPLSVGVMF